MSVPVIGSEGWQMAEQLLEGGEIETLVTHCLENTSWGGLCEICSSIRDGIACKVSDKFSIGTENLVRLVEFEDGVRWVARIWMLASDAETDVGIAASAEKVMESQTATYKYLKKYTTIPVPEVYATNACRNVEVGPPYMLLTYIHGTVADALELEEVNVNRLLKQMASMMVELARCKFDCIGCIFTNRTGDFEIGPVLETDTGPYTTANEYYEAISDHRFHLYADQHFENNRIATHDTGLHLPFLFNNLMPVLSNSAVDNGSFSLTNTDFGFHNILVDENFDIVGLIDCDGIMAAPLHVVAQPPKFCGVNIAIPGIQETNPFVLEFAAKGRERFDTFVELVAAAEKTVDAATPVSKAMHSDGAMLVAGLEAYTGLQGWRNMDWINGYWFLYYRNIRGPSAAVEFPAADTGYVDETEGEDKNEDTDGEEEDRECCPRNTREDEKEEEDTVEELQKCCPTNPEDKRSSEESVIMEREQKDLETLSDVTIEELSEHGLQRRDCYGHFERDEYMGAFEKLGTDKDQINKRTIIEQVKQERPETLNNEVRENIMVNLMHDPLIQLKDDLTQDLKKGLKEELKQELWLEIKADLIKTPKLADNEAGIETTEAKQFVAKQVNESIAIVKEDRAGGQRLYVRQGIPRNAKERVEGDSAVKWESATDLKIGREVDKEGVDSDEEQGACSGNAQSHPIMGP